MDEEQRDSGGWRGLISLPMLIVGAGAGLDHYNSGGRTLEAAWTGVAMFLLTLCCAGYVLVRWS